MSQLPYYINFTYISNSYCDEYPTSYFLEQGVFNVT